jgi:hypothetical protein
MKAFDVAARRIALAAQAIALAASKEDVEKRTREGRISRKARGLRPLGSLPNRAADYYGHRRRPAITPERIKATRKHWEADAAFGRQERAFFRRSACVRRYLLAQAELASR